jgi:hypothetical protein
MVLIHAKAAGVHKIFDMVVHSIHNIWHIRRHAAGGLVLCDQGPFLRRPLSTWIVGLVAARLGVLSAGAFQ